MIKLIADNENVYADGVLIARCKNFERAKATVIDIKNRIQH